MFARVATAFTFLFFISPFLAVADEPASQCNPGDLQCCSLLLAPVEIQGINDPMFIGNSVQSASSSPIALLLGLLGVTLSDLNVLVGITCTPISVIGVGGNSCNAQPVCCKNNDFNGLVAIECTPVDLNL